MGSPAGGLPRWLEAPLAAVALMAASPLLAGTALAVALTSPGGPWFRQVRAGRGGRPFTLIKLRTMAVAPVGDGGAPQVTAGGDARITPVGRWLRRTKLDELPTLWNVVRGDLSLVGPRPEVYRYVDLEDPRWRRVLAVRPGLTDPVTVRLRDEEALLAEAVERGEDLDRFYRLHLQPKKLEGYLTYLEERSWVSDLAVLWQTVRAIFGWRPEGER